MEVEFKEEKKECSHVGLYKSKNKDLIVFFSNEYNDKEGIIVSSGTDSWVVGEACENFVSCLEEQQWQKINANSVTFTW